MALGTGVRLSTTGSRAGRVAAAAVFTPAALAGLSSWLDPTAAALPASASDGLTQLAWGAHLPVIRPFPLLPSMTEVRVYAPSGATPDGTNLGTAGRYNWHTRIWAVSASDLLVMCSRGMNNEDSPGQRSYLHISTDGGATWGAGIELIPSQDTLAETTGTGVVTWPGCFAPNAAVPTSPYAVLAIEDVSGGTYDGRALVARTVAANGTLGSLFRITSEDYTPAGGAVKIEHDAVLGPSLLAYWKTYGHWGGNIAGNQSWTVTYEAGANHANERSVAVYPPDPTKFYAVWKNKGGFTANRVPAGKVNADGTISTAPTATDIPTSPNAPVLGTTTDGRIFLIDSPTNTGSIDRDPLAVSFCDPGKSTFNHTWAVRQDESIAPVYAGSFKGSASGYADAVQFGDYLYVSYGVHKEDIWVAKVPVPKQVQTWTDAGAATALTAPSVAARPTRQECQAVSEQLVYFDGAQVGSRTANLPGGTAGCCTISFRPTRVRGTQYLAAVADTGSADNFWGVRLNGTFIEVVSSVGATVNVCRGAFRFANNTNYVVTVESSGTAWTLRVNDASSALSVISGSNTGDWPGDVSSPNAYAIGALVTTTTGSYYRGWVGDVVLTAAAVSAGQRTSLETYVGDRIGGLSGTVVLLDEQFTVPAASLAAIDANVWTVVSGAGTVFHSQLKVGTATAVITADVGVANYTATVRLVAGADNAQFLVRYVDENNYYMVRVSGGNLQIYSRVAGSTTQRASVAGAGSLPVTLTVVLNGASIQATVGATVASYGSVLDTTATKVGFRGEDNLTIFDSLRVTG
jgi:hypothetical protein